MLTARIAFFPPLAKLPIFYVAAWTQNHRFGRNDLKNSAAKPKLPVNKMYLTSQRNAVKPTFTNPKPETEGIL